MSKSIQLDGINEQVIPVLPKSKYHVVLDK